MPFLATIPGLFLAGSAIKGATSTIGAFKQANAAKKSAAEQAAAAKREGDLLSGAADKANLTLTDQYRLAREAQSPYAQFGTDTLGLLSQFIGQGFKAPTMDEASQNPGYQFALQEGQKALERSASAKGTLNTGGTLKAITQYGQNLATQNYGDVYNRARGEYNDRFNMLSGSIGVGQGAANNLSNLGMDYASAYGRNLLTGAGAQGNAITGAANANSAGRIASADAWSKALSDIGISANQLLQLKAMGFLDQKKAA